MINGSDLYKEIQDIIGEHIETKLYKTVFSNNEKYNPDTMMACVAGGSVADRLYTHETGIESPIKDVDIFVNRFWGELGKNNEYNGIQYFINKKYNTSFYNITDVKWDGKINIVAVNIFEPCLNEEEFAQYIIRGFDLNCCQAAISMKSKKLFTAPDFDEFLKTKDLKVTNPHNVGSTALRIVKKEELLKNVNKEREFDIMCNGYYYYNNKMYMGTFIKKDNPKTKYIENIKTHFSIIDHHPYYQIIPLEEKNILHLENLEHKKSTFNFIKNYLTYDEIREIYERKKKELQ
jgi:hypothetical protein